MKGAETKFFPRFVCASIATMVVFAPYAFIVFKTPSIWYYYPWLDIPFHIAGGVVASFWTFLTLSVIRHSPIQPLSFFITVFIIGLGWEYFEYLLDIYTHAHWLGSPLDTAGDLLNDMIGAGISWIFFRKQT